MEGSFIVGDSRSLAGIAQLLPYPEHRLLIFGKVEISCQDYRKAVFVDLSDALEQKSGTFSLGFLALMVEVSVDEKELETAFLMLEYGPGGNSLAGSVPSLRRLVWGFAKPECSGFLERDLLFVVENGNHLTLLAPVVSADSHVAVTGAALN